MDIENIRENIFKFYYVNQLSFRFLRCFNKNNNPQTRFEC